MTRTFKENPDDVLVFRQQTTHGLELAWRRPSGTTYGMTLPGNQETAAYLVSEGLDPNAFFPEVGTVGS